MQLDKPFATVTPTLDGEVLSVLARVDAAFTTGQLHRVVTQASEDGLRRALRRLAAQGVVSADRVGNAYSYRLNRDHLAAEHIVGLANMSRTLLARIACELDRWDPKPAYAAVFGSAARGTMRADSDIDLLLIRPDAVDRDFWDAQVHALVEAVTRWTGNDARPLQFDEVELSPSEPVLREVLAQGLTVAGTHDWLANRLRRAKASA